MAKPFFIWTVILGLTLTTSFCKAQKINISLNDSLARKKTTTNGLLKLVKNNFIKQFPQTNWFVQCGLQDNAGNLWFGTNADGVYCYDGKSFTNFTRRDGLCNNDVLCILEDKNGNIWFGTRGGLCLYKLTSETSGKKKFTNIPISANGQYLANNFVWTIMQDKTDKIWIGTNEGVFVYDPFVGHHDSIVFKPFLNDERISNKNKLKLRVVQKIAEDKKGNIWFASGDFEGEGICYFNGNTLGNFYPDNIKSFRSVLETKTGDLLFFATRQGAYRYDGKTIVNLTEKTELKSKAITAAMEDNNGNLWFGTDCYGNNNEEENKCGAWCIDENSFKLFSTKDGLSHNSVLCIVQDRGGNIWFGTRNTGLCCYNGKTFTDYTD